MAKNFSGIELISNTEDVEERAFIETKEAENWSFHMKSQNENKD
jgi:hypothetical protein